MYNKCPLVHRPRTLHSMQKVHLSMLRLNVPTSDEKRLIAALMLIAATDVGSWDAVCCFQTSVSQNVPLASNAATCQVTSQDLK